MRSVCLLPVLVALALLLAGVSTVGLAMPATDYVLATTDGLALSISSDGQVTSLQIDGRELVTTPAPAFSIRDLSDAGAVISPNLIPNAGFEDGLTGWSELTNNGLDVSIVISPTHSGDLALALANPATDTYAFAAYASAPVPVTPGQRYRFSAWFRSATGYVTSPSGPPTLWQMTLWRELQHTNGLYVQWLDAVGQPLGDPQLAVALHWNAGHWRILRRELTAPSGAQQATAIIAAKLRDQTLWVDDLALVPAPEPDVEVLGSVAPCVTAARESQTAAPENAPAAHGVSSASDSPCLVHAATLTNGLAVSMTYTAHADHIAVHGEIVDATGQDRALDVTWGVPLEATGGWRWWDDAHTWRPITGTGSYATAISAIYDGWLPISLYPYAGIGGPAVALALGLPLDRPQLALLSYDGATRRYGATFHLGISPQAVKVGSHATFDLLLYRSDPDWGFRDIIARHRALQPEAYTTTIPVYDYAGAEQGWYFTQAGAQQALANDAANIYSAQYTVGELPLKVAASSDPRPTLDQTLAAVTNTLSSPRPWEAGLARAITQSAVVDPNGDWSLKHIGVYPWALDWWEASWAANLDPDLTDGLSSWIMEWRVTPAFTATTEAGAHLDGVQIDNFMSTPTFDLRPPALTVADWPLAYTPHTYQPAVHNGFAFREHMAFLRDYLDTAWGTDRGISVNFWGLGHPNYLSEYIDVFGSEGNLKGNGEGPNWNAEILDYRRAIAFGRPYLFANQTVGLTASEAYTGTRLAILYGVRSGHGPNGQGWEPEAEQIVSDTAALVTRYWAAGWEPLTYARSDSDDAWVERFGAPAADHGPQTADVFGGQQSAVRGLYFTIHNRADPTHTVTITIETVPLGLTDPSTAAITDIVVTQTLPFTLTNGDIVVSLTLGPRDTRVLQVSGGVAAPTPLYLPLVVRNWRQPWPTPTPTPTPTAMPLPVSFYRLRFELSTTDRGAWVTAQDTADFLTTRLVGVHGDPTRQGVTMHSVWVGQDSEGSHIGITADYAVTPAALDQLIPYLFEQTAEGSSVLRVFNVDGEETELVAEIHHIGADPLVFSLDLSALQGTPPLEENLPTIEPSRLLWAYYYPWYTMGSWNSTRLQDWPATLYSSDDPVAIERHIDQAQRVGVDGFIVSWWGPGGYTDENLGILLDLAQERNFFVMIYFETLEGSEPRDEATIVKWLRYLISTHGDHPAFVKVDGKPVIGVWASPTVPDTTWGDIFAQLKAEGHEAIFLAAFNGEWPKLNSLEIFDGMHSYSILSIIQSSDQVPTVLAQTYATTGRAVRYYPLLADLSAPKIWAATAQPGYDDHLIPGRVGIILEREDGDLYRSTFDAALNSDPDWIFISTWNEWWEHTYIEPSQNYGDQYLQITREYGDIFHAAATLTTSPSYLSLMATNWHQHWSTPTPINPRVTPVSEASETWQPIPSDDGYLRVAIGSFADAEVLALPTGGYRLYVEDMEVHNIVSFFSTGGLAWTREEGVRLPGAAFPDAVLLPGGLVRLYFQQGGQINSALSTDGGLTFVPEPGSRVEPGWHGTLDADQVGASTTILLPDGRFRMYYRAGDQDNAYFNGMKTVILSAISNDGLNWSPEEGARVAPEDWVDPQAPANNRYVDGPEAVLTGDGSVRLYFWGVSLCDGVCLSESQDGLVFEHIEQVFPNADSPGGGNIGDPTILPLADGSWLMYYGNGTGDNNGIWIAQRTATPTPTPTAVPESQCVRDVNNNGEGDVVDVMATATTPGCQVFLSLIVQRWGQPWPTPTPAPTIPAASPTPSASDLRFTPDSGFRAENASNPAASVDPQTGTVYLFYEDRTTTPGRRMVATSAGGLNFANARPATDADNRHFPFHLQLPDGTWRQYFFDPQAAALKSQSSTDGVHYAPDPGVRYRLQPADNGTMGVRDQYVDPSGGVVLLYIGDMPGVNNIRRAYSPPGDNGWTFTFEDANVLGDAEAGGGGHSYVDPKSILLPGGRRRLFTMSQGPLPPQPGERSVGKIYSFISQDGKTYTVEPGIRLQATDFTEFVVWSLNDPVVVRLPDGRYRMYVAALVDDGADGTRWVIVSATAG